MAVKVVHRSLKATSELMCVTPAGKIGNCTCGMSKIVATFGKKSTHLSPFYYSKNVSSRFLVPIYLPLEGSGVLTLFPSGK